MTDLVTGFGGMRNPRTEAWVSSHRRIPSSPDEGNPNHSRRAHGRPFKTERWGLQTKDRPTFNTHELNRSTASCPQAVLHPNPPPHRPSPSEATQRRAGISAATFWSERRALWHTPRTGSWTRSRAESGGACQPDSLSRQHQLRAQERLETGAYGHGTDLRINRGRWTRHRFTAPIYRHPSTSSSC
jgi:hypothetical protein